MTSQDQEEIRQIIRQENKRTCGQILIAICLLALYILLALILTSPSQQAVLSSQL